MGIIQQIVNQAFKIKNPDATAVSEAELVKLLNAPSLRTLGNLTRIIRQESGATVRPPNPTYSTLADAEDRTLMQRAGQDLRQFNTLYVPVSAIGEVKGSPFDVDGNGLAILPRSFANGVEIESSDTARIYVKINNESNPYIPMSFNNAPSGYQKGDATFIGGRINKLWISVAIPTQDIVNQPVLILAILKSIAVVGQFGGGSLYAPPNNPAAALQGAGVTIGAGINIPTPQAPPPAPPFNPPPPPYTPGGGSGGTGRK